jgi:hypothetical protein
MITFTALLDWLTRVEGFDAEPICDALKADGIEPTKPAVLDRLRAYGNVIVAPLAAEFVKAVMS